ncbi:MAG: pyridoxal-phosphate dependent enzyme [Alphaproteobacteria bacterium]|nr:pyridoxal-phosphate dependent enzyme [Alphaproteobacteria bacterium]
MTISYEDVLLAAENHRQIPGLVLHTPLMRSLRGDQETGVDMYCKMESLQRTGAFKMRGAANAILTYKKKHGHFPEHVTAWSSGNHAQAVAYVARTFGIPASIIMPKDAPEVKRYNTAFLGANVVLYDRYTENREEVAKENMPTESYNVPPYNHPDIIAGQGTCGLEIVADCKAQGFVPDAVVVPVGGGGLLAGVAVAIHHAWPTCKIYGAEPQLHNDTHLSLKSGVLTGVHAEEKSICDALLTPIPGELVFPLIKEHVEDVLLLTDDQVLNAVGSIHTDLRVIAEPGGAIAVAAVETNPEIFAGKKVVVIISGGNVGADLLRQAVDDATANLALKIAS